MQASFIKPELIKPIIDKDVFFEIKNIKDKIGSIDHKDWINARKFMNIYEYPKVNYNGYFLPPVSRAYYKLWEILFENKFDCDGDILHLAESPGGFIQAMDKYKKTFNMYKGKLYTISLYTENYDYDVPKFHKNIINNKNVEILKFSKGNGDLTNYHTFINLLISMRNKNIKVITADGGINDNGDFDNKEINHINLIFSEIINAVFNISDGGVFILKIFDIFTESTLHLLFLLEILFENMEIIKPLTSRSTNSEKYVLCSGFKKNLMSVSMRNFLFKTYVYLNDNNVVLDKLFLKVPYYFKEKISKINNKYINEQIKNIKEIFEYINNDKSFYSGHQTIKDKTVFEWLKKYKLIRK
jgi:23S rRNA U2552 (ribose-2'-O)-methylase RlmE/FtsJ